MKRILFIISCIAVCQTFCNSTSFAQFVTPTTYDYVNGFSTSIKGENLIYHAPYASQSEALLVRAAESNSFIEWETATTPAIFNHDFLTFVWYFGIDVSTENRSFQLLINNETYFTFRNPSDTLTKILNFKNKNGAELTFHVTEVDKYGDFMGFALLKLPANQIENNSKLNLKVKGENTKSNAWYMTFKQEIQSPLQMQQVPAIANDNGQNKYVFEISWFSFEEAFEAIVAMGAENNTIQVQKGQNRHTIFVTPPTKNNETIRAQIKIARLQALDKIFNLEKVKTTQIHLIHHSHVDIGYTDQQSEVIEKQIDNIKSALKLIENNSFLQENSKFKWNEEIAWTTQKFLEQASEEEREKFIAAVNDGYIELNALYANILTELCSENEMIQSLAYSQKLSLETGVPIKSAMISDIPGLDWGMVTVLAQYGIKYLSLGTNTSHRVGNIIEKLGDKPFYWLSPSGKDTVLCWLHKKGYSHFHTGLGAEKIQNKLTESYIFEYLAEMQNEGYPYEIQVLRYNIGSDNGTTDPNLSTIVEQWNKKFVTPKLIISTISEAFKNFEQAYKNQIPVLTGAITPYWTDGAYSSAKETITNRQTSNKLSQIQILNAIYPELNIQSIEIERAWQNILLFNEHTWGAWNSISDPESEFTINQWNTKKEFCDQAQTVTDSLEQLLLGTNKKLNAKNLHFEVINTTLNKQSGFVELEIEQLTSKFRIVDNSGHEQSYQIIDNNKIIVFVENIPPLGTKTYRIENKKPLMAQNLVAEQYRLMNNIIELEIDKNSGSITKLLHKDLEYNFVDNQDNTGLNEFIYIDGRSSIYPQKVSEIKTEITEKGSQTACLKITSSAAGCDSLIREIRIFNDSPMIEIINTIYKRSNYSPEAVYMNFPFKLENPEYNISCNFGSYNPQNQILSGGCLNYLAIQNSVSLKNNEYGILWYSPDINLIEFDTLTTDANHLGWLTNLKPSSKFFSYVLNNYWETNYKASQEGKITFRYYLVVGNQDITNKQNKYSNKITNPLLVKTYNSTISERKSLFSIDNEFIALSAMQQISENQYLIVLYNQSKILQNVNFIAGRINLKNLWNSNLKAEKIKIVPTSNIEFLPQETKSFVIETI